MPGVVGCGKDVLLTNATRFSSFFSSVFMASLKIIGELLNKVVVRDTVDIK